MAISRISRSRKNNPRYFPIPHIFLYSPKTTLKPSSNFSYSFHQTLSFCYSSSHQPPSICGFHSSLLQKRLCLSDSSSDPFPECHFDTVSRLNIVSLRSTFGHFYCIPFHKSQSLMNNFSGFSSKCRFGTLSQLKKVSSLIPTYCCFDTVPLHKRGCSALSGFSAKCNSAPLSSSGLHLLYGFSQSLKRLPVLTFSNRSSSSSSCVFPVSSSFRMPMHCDGRLFGSCSVSSSGGSSLDSIESNVFKGEKRCNVINGRDIKLSSTMNTKIVEIIKSGNTDMESKLSFISVGLRVESVREIFLFLNFHKINGLRFFRWLRCYNPKWHRSAEVCSHVICNCGCLGDFKTMKLLLHEFSAERICLDENAFRFLPLFHSSKDSLSKSVTRVVSLLGEVGGSCHKSGIWGLIEMFCSLESFEMARFVIEITGKKDAHINMLVRHRCKREHFEEAKSIIREMQDPTVTSYNYLIGSLCKADKFVEASGLVGEMESKGVHPDDITFDILVHYSCNSGKLDIAKQWIDKMVNSGLCPRISTHGAMLKAFFRAELHQEARNYVIDSTVKFPHSSPIIYSVFADLHQGNGRLKDARDILVEMMAKGLRPNFRIYVKILNQLRKTGRGGQMAQDLEDRYRSL